MSQADIVAWLVNQRESGNDRYFCTVEICKALGCDRLTTYPKITQLYIHGFIEIFVPMNHTKLWYRRKVRAKAELCTKRWHNGGL
jgi:hypothetical protein